jgi:DNA mismatch endonuclease (patch repair protein)
MADVFTPQKRSEFMSAVRTTSTRPEQVIARALFARGFRYRIGVKALPGKPDLVFPKWKSVILVHGCFWHGHDCHLFKWPKTRVEFWEAKIHGNRARDARQRQQLRELGWRVCIVWECATRLSSVLLDAHMDSIEEWLKGTAVELEIRS